MKKLKNKNKKIFSEQVKTLIMENLLIVLTIIIGNYFVSNGLHGLFTINMYEEAFETNQNDILLINRLQVIIIIGIFALVPSELKYNKEILDLEREEEELCRYLLEH